MIEFKEVKVGTLSKEEGAILKQIIETRDEGERLIHAAQSGNTLFWRVLRSNHQLDSQGQYVIKGDDIYVCILE